MVTPDSGNDPCAPGVSEHQKYAWVVEAELCSIPGGTIRDRREAEGYTVFSWTASAWSAAAAPALAKITSTPEGRAYLESFIDGWPGLNPMLSDVLGTREGQELLNVYLCGTSA